MAALNNILKAIEGLKILQETTVSSDPAIRYELKLFTLSNLLKVFMNTFQRFVFLMITEKKRYHTV